MTSEAVSSEVELSECSLTSVWMSWSCTAPWIMALDMLVMLLQSTCNTATSAFSTVCADYEEYFIMNKL